MSEETRPSLRDLIESGRVHVIDGAMGTALYGRGVFVSVCYDGLNLEDPGVVEQVHRDYVQAGAEILETNTFGANPIKLSSYGLEDRTEEINRAAVDLARRAAGDRAFVVGAIGPLGIRIEPFGPTSREEARGFYADQVAGLLDGGVDGFMLETFSDLNELEQAFNAVRERSELPVFCQITVGEDGRTSFGTSPEAMAREATAWGADVIGLNCSVGPAVILDAIERMARVTDRPLSALPNAGLPRVVGDRKIYLASPEYMAQYARRMIEAGARFVGGCCGTTPEHIRALSGAVVSVQPKHPHVHVEATQVELERAVEPVPLADRSAWGNKLASGEFVTTVEINPPKGWDPAEMVAVCTEVAAAGADAVNVVDSPRGQARMSPLPAALVIEREVGIETITHYTCRDRNMPSMMSDLLGAAAGGLRNLLLVTGDPPATGPYPDATAVFDIDSIGLTNLVRGLNQGVDPGGNAIGSPTEFAIGVVANQGAVDLDKEADRFMWKVEAGAEFVMTQPVFDPQRLDLFLEHTSEWRIPVIAGLWSLTSLRNAEFLANEVPGVQVPSSILRRMARAQEDGSEVAEAEGLRIAIEIFDQIRDRVQGVHIGMPSGQPERALALLRRVRASPG
jgi:methionine synthase / methylenetetrahydrofolate reductase (NADH)